MKKFPEFLALFLIVIVSLVSLSSLGRAQTVYANLGPLSLPIPWENMNAVYLYSVTAKVNEVGGEMVLAQLKVGSFQNNPIDVDFTAGGVLEPSGTTVGTGYIGTNLALPNPVPQLNLLNTIQPGLFGGYAFDQHDWQFGLKAVIPIFQG